MDASRVARTARAGSLAINEAFVNAKEVGVRVGLVRLRS